MDLRNYLLENNPIGTKEFHVTIKVTPASPKNEINSVMSDGTIKVRIHAAPEAGKANTELVKFLAEALETTEDNIEIISGHGTSRKQLSIFIPA